MGRGVSIAAALLLAACAGCVAPETRGLAVWSLADCRPLDADSTPTPESETYSAATRTTRLTAAINETVAFQLAIRAEAAAFDTYDVVISDLAGPKRVIPAREAVTLYRQNAVRVESLRAWYPLHTLRSGSTLSVFDQLVPWSAPRGGGPLRVDSGRTYAAWVDVRIPPTTEPGDYRARIELRKASGAVAYRGELRLAVLPVAIPSEPALPAIARVDLRDLLVAHMNWPVESTEETRLLADVPSHQAAIRLLNATMSLLQQHRLNPVLANALPKYRSTGQRGVEIDWRPYDDLVTRYLDGSAFADRTPLAVWLAPVSESYPDPQRNGGFDSPRYARLLAAYLTECQAHFAERGWLDRSVLRVLPPRELSADSVAAEKRAAGIVRQSETRFPLVTHLPPRSLRGVGWHESPEIDLPDVAFWAPPPHMWESDAMLRERGMGRQAWLTPGDPPYSGSLSVEAPPTDARELGWQAARYGAQAMWIEHAADVANHSDPTRGNAPALIYDGAAFGIAESPIPSVRLKRLRRGLLDYDLVRLLERRGKVLLASRTAQQLVRWAFVDAADANLLTTRPGGWTRDPYAYWLAREMLLLEIAGENAPQLPVGDRQLAHVADWSRLMAQTSGVDARVRGVRLAQGDSDLAASVFVDVANSTERPLVGKWTLPALPVGWKLRSAKPTATPAGARGAAILEVSVGALSSNAAGVYPFSVLLDSEESGAFEALARLAVVTCPVVDSPPAVDGSLADWPVAANCNAADFRLVRGEGAPNAAGVPRLPALATLASLCTDRRRLYVGVTCAIPQDETPLWSADNTIPIDGAMPWGQDVVELLLCPRNTQAGTGSDIYCLQIKPSGVAVGRRGCRTNPPMCASEPWSHNAEVVVRTKPGAWVVELAIPLASFEPAGARNRIWGLNVARLDARRGEYSSWSGAVGNCYLPELLGNMIFTE